MLTLFAMPKPFEGHIEVIQRNAIRSWTLLDPRPQIILIGNETGTAEIVREFELTHIPEVGCNEYGTPFLPDIFARAETSSDSPLLCYVNADIILTSDFMRAVETVQRTLKRFVMAGRRWDLDVIELLEFDRTWEVVLRERTLRDGWLEPPGSIDYFVYSRGLWGEIPPFLIGRFNWDNWLLYRARARKAALVDATASVMAIHQNHGYNMSSVATGNPRLGPEAMRNIALVGGEHHLYTLRAATHLLTEDGLKPGKPGRRQLEFLQSNWRFYSRRAFRALQAAADNRPAARPFLRPVLAAIRAVRPGLSRVGRMIVKFRDKGLQVEASAPPAAGQSPVVQTEKE